MKKKWLALIIAVVVSAFACSAFLSACGKKEFKAPENVKVASNVLSWTAVENADNGYTVKINDGTLTVDESELDLTSDSAVDKLQSGENKLSVKVNATDSYKESPYSTEVSYTYSPEPSTGDDEEDPDEDDDDNGDDDNGDDDNKDDDNNEETPEPAVLTFEIDEEAETTYWGERYFVYNFTPTVSGTYIFTISGESDGVEDAYVYSSEEGYLDNYGLIIEGGYYGSGCTGEYDLIANMEYDLTIAVPDEDYCFGEYTLTIVKKVIVPVTSVTFEEDEVNVRYGQTLHLAPVFNEGATNKNGEWTTSNSSVVSVDSGLKAVGEGTATLTFTSKDNPELSASINVNVSKTTIKDGDDLDLVEYEYAYFLIKGEPNTKYAVNLLSDSGDVYYVIYTVAEGPSTGSVSSSNSALGLTTNDAGEVEVCFRVYSTGTYTVEINEPVLPTGITVTDPSSNDPLTEYTIYVGGYGDYDFKNYITVAPANATDKTFTVTVEDEEVATYDMYGALKGLKAGTTTLTITANGADGVSCNVNLIVKEYELEAGDNKLTTFYVTYTLNAEPNTKYVVTAEPTDFWYNVQENDNYNNSFGSASEYAFLEVTTDEDGKAYIYVSCYSSEFTLTVIVASDFEYPDLSGPTYGTDLDGRLIVAAGENPKLSVPEEGTKAGIIYLSFTGSPNSEYKVTLSTIAYQFGQCDYNGDYVGTFVNNWDEEWNSIGSTVKECVITTDEYGVAYVKLDFNNTAITSVDVTIASNDFGTRLNLNENTGLNLNGFSNHYFTFKGEANTEYTVTLSEEAYMLGQCDNKGEYLTSGTSNTDTVTLTTDANGVAYLRVFAWDTLSDLTITVTEADAE